MTGQRFDRAMNLVASRIHLLRILRRQTGVWILLLVPTVMLVLLLPSLSESFPLTESIALVLLTLIGIVTARLLTQRPDELETARLIEKEVGQLDDSVLTAVKLRGTADDTSALMKERVLREADRQVSESTWQRVVPFTLLGRWRAASLLSYAMLIAAVMFAGRQSVVRGGLAAGGDDADGSSAAAPISGMIVEPGDVDVELGSPLTIVARRPSFDDAVVTVELVTADDRQLALPFQRAVDEGVYAVQIPEITADGFYRVRAGDETSDEFTITVFERPRVNQVDAIVTPPDYSGQDEEKIEDTLRFSVVEGSRVRLQLSLNKKVAAAELENEETGARVALAAAVDNPSLVEAVIECQDAEAWIVHLVDDKGRVPVDETRISIRVRRNERPEIKVLFPGKDTQVSPLQEMTVEAAAQDDFGLFSAGVMYSLGGGEPQTIEILNPEGQTTTAQLLRMIELESLNAKPDDLVSYSFFADDIASDGTTRRTYSDMFFAEVRRFEEIFREGQQQNQQQQQQQQQQQGNQMEELAGEEKEIVTALWNLIRSGRNRTDMVEDVGVIIEGQAAIREKFAEAAAEAASDPESLQIRALVAGSMQAVEDILSTYDAGQEDDTLTRSMSSAQAAYQGLLKLRAKESEVQQGQPGGGGGGGAAGRSQQQLNQLELDNQQQRYESESQAAQAQQQSNERREQLQVLNRLKELARRQSDINQRVKDLESELRAAQTDEEREEIERELKRLREQQRDLLRDVDELSQRMDQPEARKATSDLREQVEQARNNVRQASEALQEGQLSQAVSEGTRAERKFEQLRDEVRERTASRFDDAARDLRQQARDLSDRQREIAQELDRAVQGEDERREGSGAPEGERPSLRSPQLSADLPKQLAEQRDRVEQIKEQAEDIIREAETAEPLLSRRLYDTLREMRGTPPEQALQQAEFMTERGFMDRAVESERQARESIEQLREGVESAAEAVLGSESEALRRASDELRDLTNQLENEVNAADPQGQRPAGAGQNQDAEQDGGQRQPGSNREGESQEGQPAGAQQQAGTSTFRTRPDAAQGETGQRRQEGQEPGQEQGQQPGEGQQAEGQEGQRPGSGQRRPGERDARGEQNAEGQQGQRGTGQQEQPEDGQQPGEGQRGQQPGEGQQGEQPGEQPGEGQQGQGEQGQGQQGQGQQRQGQQQSVGPDQSGGGGQQGGSFLRSGGRIDGQGRAQSGPLTGESFSDFSDRLRDIEESLEDPELRNRVGQIRDRARSIRAEFKRHATEPEWDLVRSNLLGEMQELQSVLKEELARQSSDRSLVPIDRDPVPERFEEIVRKYYEELGQVKERTR